MTGRPGTLVSNTMCPEDESCGSDIRGLEQGALLVRPDGAVTFDNPLESSLPVKKNQIGQWLRWLF